MELAEMGETGLVETRLVETRLVETRLVEMRLVEKAEMRWRMNCLVDPVAEVWEEAPSLVCLGLVG